VTEYITLCKCHEKPVDIVPNQGTSGNKYYCSVTGDQIFSFIHKEVDMNKKSRDPDETWPGDMAEFPDEEEKADKAEESSFPEEEAEKKDNKGAEQPFLFEGDKVYNALQTSLTDVNDALKKVDKQIDNKKLEKSLFINRKEELQEAIKIYEKQREVVAK
jgi:hypothetical protein